MKYPSGFAVLLFAGAFLIFILVRAEVLVETRNSLPRIEIDQPSASLGNIFINRSIQRRFTLSNSGTAQLLLLNIKSNCECAVGYLARRSLEPGQSTMLNVIFTPKKTGQHRRVSVLIESNDPQNPFVILTLQANVVGNPTTMATHEENL